MDNYPSKEKIRNLFSVIAGVAITIFLAFFLLLFFAGTGFLRWTDGGEETIHTELTARISLILAIALPGFAGGWTTALISTRKHRLHVFLTGIILTIIVLISNGIDFSYYDLQDLVYFLLIPIFVFLGGWAGFRKKN